MCMSDPIEELNKNTFKQNKLTFKKYLDVILPVYYQLILSDGIVDESETAGFIQFLRELDFNEAGIAEKQAEFKNFEMVKNRPLHETALEKLAKSIQNEPYNFREYLFVHIVLFGSIENINVSEQNYIIKVIEALEIDEHKAEEVIEIIRKYLDGNKNIKYFL
jgi:hypothetical protein